jgi:hypothetical protein
VICFQPSSYDCGIEPFSLLLYNSIVVRLCISDQFAGNSPSISLWLMESFSMAPILDHSAGRVPFSLLAERFKPLSSVKFDHSGGRVPYRLLSFSSR